MMTVTVSLTLLIGSTSGARTIAGASLVMVMMLRAFPILLTTAILKSLTKTLLLKNFSLGPVARLLEIAKGPARWAAVACLVSSLKKAWLVSMSN